MSFVDTDVDAVDRIWGLVHEFPVTHIIAVTPQGRGDPTHHRKPLKQGNEWIQKNTGERYITRNKELVDAIRECQRLGAKIGIHGLIHIDYRRLSFAQQLKHVITAQRVLGSLFGDIEYFVPPFNKYNKDTVKVCRERGLELVPSYYEADTKIINNNVATNAVEEAVNETERVGNFAYHPYWLQGGWGKDSLVINGKKFNIEESRWCLNDSLPALRKLLKGVTA